MLTGIQTVKAQNVEMVGGGNGKRYSKYISRTFEDHYWNSFKPNRPSSSKALPTYGVMGWCTLVLNGELTLGQLIAFRIISGYVTQPLLRLSTIWQRVQELRVSFERLADIVDTPEESTKSDQGKISLPPVIGELSFEDISFRFNKNSKNVLNNINLEIPSGTFVGVVGQSGSGKSTLMKLIPRLYSPNSGRILIDGYDIDKVNFILFAGK